MLCAARTEKRLIPPNSAQIGRENARLERARPSTAARPRPLLRTAPPP